MCVTGGTDTHKPLVRRRGRNRVWNKRFRSPVFPQNWQVSDCLLHAYPSRPGPALGRLKTRAVTPRARQSLKQSISRERSSGQTIGFVWTRTKNASWVLVIRRWQRRVTIIQRPNHKKALAALGHTVVGCVQDSMRGPIANLGEFLAELLEEFPATMELHALHVLEENPPRAQLGYK